MRTYHVSLEQCLIHVVKARPCVLPNDGFLKQLILYDRFLVDRRRQHQELALAKAVNVAPTVEIPIQSHPPPAGQPAHSTAPVILAPPQCPAVQGSNATSMSSVDSSSFGQSSTSSILSSTSADSIHVIPIQVPAKVLRSDKVKFILSIELYHLLFRWLNQFQLRKYPFQMHLLLKKQRRRLINHQKDLHHQIK
jgi:hypothetical protein